MKYFRALFKKMKVIGASCRILFLTEKGKKAVFLFFYGKLTA